MSPVLSGLRQFIRYTQKEGDLNVYDLRRLITNCTRLIIVESQPSLVSQQPYRLRQTLQLHSLVKLIK